MCTYIHRNLRKYELLNTAQYSLAATCKYKYYTNLYLQNQIGMKKQQKEKKRC